jgi:electron transfer flavoprotein-quinone oxidoreductase
LSKKFEIIFSGSDKLWFLIEVILQFEVPTAAAPVMQKGINLRRPPGRLNMFHGHRLGFLVYFFHDLKEQNFPPRLQTLHPFTTMPIRQGAAMKQYKFDIIIIGAGPAGVTAAGALAGTGISVALLEAGVYAGAENWSGCVYFAESLAAEDCFGPEAVAAAPFERRVFRRGTLLHNGLDVVGAELTNPGIFENCYTVLRPVYDPYFAALAAAKGAVHIVDTTVTSMIRKENRVVGVQTNRGPLYADVVFIAEGDASHLVRSEQLERMPEPHYLQGVKGVLSLAPAEIEKRFKLGPGEGAAYELLLRNALVAGRTAKLNVGGFLYTNKDSLSVGYVAPLDNLRKNYRGGHDGLFEWMRGLPYIKQLTDGAKLSAYGTKIVRSGGWNERPVLVENGLAVGGASAGLGVDLPFPNFTGPASATGLYFARAVKNILRQGRAFDAKNLEREYLDPLRESVYGRNARELSRWPGYFGSSGVLFNRTVDMACGAAHFLASGSLIETGRFLRNHILSFRGLKESVQDTLRAVGSLRLWKPLAAAAFNPVTLWHWIANLVKATPASGPKPAIILHIGGRDHDADMLRWPMGSLVKRLSPALLSALEKVYANDETSMQGKFAQALRIILRGLKLTDLVVLPFFGLALFLIALGTAAWDAFRFYVLKVPVDRLLAEPVMAYNEAQRKARDLDAIAPSLSLEAKLATNTYRVGTVSHIRTLWPDSLAAQPEMSQAALWWVCPARVYGYEAPLFGRGKVTVNFENCIKCESCWRAEPQRVLWGRHTDHRLIYRPETAAIPILLDALSRNHPPSLAANEGPTHSPFGKNGHGGVEVLDEKLWHLSDDLVRAIRATKSAAASFIDAVGKLPASADAGRRAWPLALGKRLSGKLQKLESGLANDGRHGAARIIQADRNDMIRRLAEGGLFHALYCCRRLDQRLAVWLADAPPEPALGRARTGKGAGEGSAVSYDLASKTFPDRIVKQWEEEPIPATWRTTLHQFISENQDAPLETIRALSSVSPALGLLAAHQLSSFNVLKQSGITLEPGICAIDAGRLDIQESIDSVRIKGALALVPAACGSLLLMANRKGHLVPLGTAGITVTPTPAIGFRAAGLADITFDCRVKKYAIVLPRQPDIPNAASYLAIALGAGDYLCQRIKEHAAGRVQFPGQMLDTEGRDGIAKLGAVKSMIARTEAWRLLLETLYDNLSHLELSTLNSELLMSTLAAMAFGPEHGTMGYDAGQVFGGFAYSEDDLLSRFYRDSSLFRFLAPGYGAAASLRKILNADGPRSFQSALGNPKSAISGEPLEKSALGLTRLAERCAAIDAKADPLLSGEAQALALGTRLLLDRIEQGLESGKSMEAEAAAFEVLLALLDEALMKAELSAGRGTVPPTALFPIEPAGAVVALDMDYEAFCTAPGAPHRSGNFLVRAFDRSPRFVPEVQLHDPRLRARWTELAGWFKKNCRDKPYDGLSIERYIEKIHGLPDEVIAAVKEHKWLATYIPESEDGLGWRKAEYYILNSAAGSFGDAGINLLIMASTSIGTTPILLGLEEELPRVRGELAPLAEDAARLGEIGARLKSLAASFASPNPAWIKKEYEEVMQLIDNRIRRTRVVKYLAANFLRAFYGAGIAGRRGDFNGFMSNLGHAAELFDHVMPDVHAALAELPRRERCHRLFLRHLGHGGVSAFALTEPTAGSDSGGVKTTAKLQSAKLTPMADGRYAFTPAEGDGTNVRYLIDADRFGFMGQGAFYRTPDNRESVIRYDRYDYATDQGVRYYNYKGSVCEFHDIGQVRLTESGPRYEYYSMTGAKMWITNGSIATQFCLYAQTAEGVTGFLVDRHSEGLKVGADEKKTGQRGSPTNEISIDSVRVPREAVLGYEGHGQVNALETLNVGRCGLAIVSSSLMHKLLDEAQKRLPSSLERDRLLGEAAAVLFGSESLSFYLVGLFDRPHESVRMESAIAKYACSEDIHECLSLVEHAYGPEGQTEKHLIEKARRDARILTIYEGTNEVQRFLILKDLVAQAANWPEVAAPKDDPAEQTLAEWKNRLRKHVIDAVGLLGDASWSDAMLQPALFPLSEMAGEVLRLECVYYRLEWLEARSGLLGSEYVAPLLAAGARAVERTLARLEHCEAKYSVTRELVAGNMATPDVRAADAALDWMESKAAPCQEQETPPPLLAPLRILSLLRPVADLSPAPRLAHGRIEEIVWTTDPLDNAGLGQALALKSSSPAKIVVDALLVGQDRSEQLLRASAGAVDRLIRLDTVRADPEVLADAVRTLELLNRYDIITVGSPCRDGESGLGAFLAGALGRTYYRKSRLDVRQDGMGLERVALPAVIALAESPAGDGPDMSAMIESAFARVTILHPLAREQRAPAQRFEPPAGAATTIKTITAAAGAAEYLKAYAARERSAQAEEYKAEVGRGRLVDGNAVWAILDPREQKSNAAVLRAARQAANAFAAALHAVVPAPRGPWPSLLGLAKENGANRAFCIDTGSGMLSIEGKRELLRIIMKTSDAPLVFAGTYWTEAHSLVGGELSTQGRHARVFSNIGALASGSQGGVVISLPAYEGRLIRKEQLEKGSAFFSVLREAEFNEAKAQGDFAAVALDYPLDLEWLMPLPAEAGPSLTQAEVIITLGYGIRDRAGLELATALKDRLEKMGLRPLFGATRKVTQDLKLLPLEAQIGQTGVRVNPKLIIALGISGAPQHIDYLGTRAEILCFNKDPDAPLMKLNQTRPTPRVHPIAGDLFVTVKELLTGLSQ